MALEGDGKIFIRQTKGPKRGRLQATISISSYVARDSAFPFQNKDPLWIRIDTKNKALIIIKKEADTPTRGAYTLKPLSNS